MSYQIRVASINGYYHVMNRGNNKLHIFKNDTSKTTMLHYFEKAAKLDGFDILAYCVMPNHYHLLVKAENLHALSKAMHLINLSYSKYYRKRTNYVGHVFQGRFTSCGINTLQYLACAIRYIHQNPVRGKLCQDAFDYHYSSFCEYGGRFDRNILPENGLLLIEALGFGDLYGFKKYHLENSFDSNAVTLLPQDSILLENGSKIKSFELEAALALKSSYGDYSLLSGPDRLNFANLLLDSTTRLSKRLIATISEIDRHKLTD